MHCQHNGGRAAGRSSSLPLSRCLLAIGAACAVAALGDGDASAGLAADEEVRVWLTTANQSQLFVPLPNALAVGSITERRNASECDTLSTRISVNSSEQFQTMVGFGAALTDASAFVIHNASAAVREELLRRLFAPLSRGGIGLNFLRVTVGISDFSVNYEPGHRTYDDCVGCVADDMDLAGFSTSMDEGHYLPTIHQVLQLNPEIVLIASPWTAPLWMKTEPSNGGGTLRPEMFDVYARYLVQYVMDYRARGIEIHYLTLQNEPGHGNCGSMPCMLLSPKHAQDLALWFEWHKRSNNLSGPKLLAYDHNWDASFWNEASYYVGMVLDQVRWIWVLAFASFSLGLYANRRNREPVANPSQLDSLLQSFLDRTPRNARSEGLLSSEGRTGMLRNARSVGFLQTVTLDSGEQQPALRRSMASMAQLRLQIVSAITSDKRLVSEPVERFVYCVTALLILIRLLGFVYFFVSASTGKFADYIGSSYPRDLLEMPGGFTLAGVAWHCYGGSPAAMAAVAVRFEHWQPPLEQHMTECSGGAWTGGSWKADFLSDQRRLFIEGARSYGQSVLRWNLALDENGGPHCSGGACCTTCRPVVTVPSWSEHIDNVTFNQEYYGLAHHSAFLSPGALRVGSAVSGPNAAGIDVVAYRNLDSSLVLVVLNDRPGGSIANLVVEDVTSDRSFQFNLPPGLATFVLAQRSSFGNDSPRDPLVVP